MNVDLAGGLLAVIASALTPVVLISAAASLILGINQKHAGLADRLRALAAEYRSTSNPARRQTIAAEVRLFARRFRYAAVAHRLLYVGVVCFVGMVLVLALTPRGASWDRLLLGLLVIGVALMLVASAAELLEIGLAGETVGIELRDVLAPQAEGPEILRSPEAPSG